MFHLGAFLRHCLLPPFGAFCQIWKSALGKHCCVLSLLLNFRDRLPGKMDILSDLVWLSYAISTYVSDPSSV